MIVNGKELLKQAREEGWAIGGFNCNDHATVEIAMQAGEALGTPIMLMIGDYANPSPEARQMSDWDAQNFMRFMRERAEASPIPVIIHLDHCPTYDGCVRAIQAGATSVMIDASMKSFEENVELTKKVVELGRACNVNVEAEIGHVGGHADSTGEVFTTPADAKRFYDETDVDMLAVSIGTVHGFYDKEPQLQYDLIKELKEAIPSPLVMHGSSGLTGEQLQKSVANGICKINFSTYFLMTAGAAMKKSAEEQGERVFINPMIKSGIEAGVEYLKEFIGYFGTPKMV